MYTLKLWRNFFSPAVGGGYRTTRYGLSLPSLLHSFFSPFSLPFPPCAQRRQEKHDSNAKQFRFPTLPPFHSAISQHTHRRGGGGEREGQFHRLTVTAALASRFLFWNTGVGLAGSKRRGREGAGHCGKGRKEEGEMVKGERERGKRSLLRKVSEKRGVEGGKRGLAWSGAA